MAEDSRVARPFGSAGNSSDRDPNLRGAGGAAYVVLNAAAKNIPWLIGGSADLAPSTKTRITQEGAGDFSADNYAGRNFHFGIRDAWFERIGEYRKDYPELAEELFRVNTPWALF
jgi:hypothetical protein